MIVNPILPLWLIIPIVIGIFILIMLSNRGIKLFIRTAILVLLFIINLRFMLPNGEVEVFNTNLDVIFAVDTTLSMDALDYNGGSRFTAVKNDLNYIVDSLSGSSFALISYDSTSTINLPLTKDANSVKVAINTLSVTDSTYARGSDVTLFKSELVNILERSAKKEGRKRIVFIISDGESTSGKGLVSLLELDDLVDGGAVLGYGTATGGKMKVETYTGSGVYEYVIDRSEGYPYKDALSIIDEENLKKIAKDLGITYVHMEKQSNVDSVLKNIRKISSLTDSNKEYYYSDIYYYFSFLLIPLFLAEIIIDRRMYK